MKDRRFFLYQHDRRSIDKDPGYKLDPEVFGPSIELDKKIREIYSTARSRTERKILDAEHELGVAKPDLSGNKQLVKCNKYTGGLDICRVYPLTAFWRYAPHSLDKVSIDGKYSLRTAEKIWSQLEAMKKFDSGGERCVVMMQTRFSCDESDENGDFMQSRTRNLQRFPHALGYLFHRYSQRTRIVRHEHVVFSTSWDSHVNVQHWNGEKPTIHYNASAGYDCPVMFVTVL